MLPRIAFLLITIFWVVMNVLLWRAEYLGKDTLGSAVPVEMVVQKILTAPDNSSLEIFHHGQKIGYCRWAANVGQDLADRMEKEDLSPEGMVDALSNYRIDFEGNIALGEFSNRLRFDFTMGLSTNHVWQDFVLRLNLRPSSWELRSVASEETIHMKAEDEGGKTERVIKFRELQDPEFLIREMEMPLPVHMLGAFGVPMGGKGTNSTASIGLKWEARNDWVTIGHTSVKAYRLEARLLERYKFVMIVSQVGEVLRVEFPDELLLVNDQLNNL